ncbi:GIN1-like protein, partial [Mya arenaria]
IQDVAVPLLFDTGSPISIISKSIWEKLGIDKPMLESNDLRLTAANGSKIDILGQATFKFDTEAKSYQWKFLVANLEGIAGIISQDFISSQGRTLSWKTLVWQTKAGRVCLFKRESSNVGRIRVEKRVIVPPETEMLVKAGPDCPLYGKTGVVEPLSRIAKKGLFVAKSVLDGQGETICSVINVTDKPIRLQTGEIIGNIGSVEDVSLINAPLNAQEMSVTVPSHLLCLIDGLPYDLTVDQVDQCKRLIVDYQDVFLSPDNKLGQGVLYKKYECDGSTHLTLVAPPDIRLEIFHLLHNHRTAVHFGRDRSVDAIKKRFYWPNISESVQRWLELCDLCAQVKPGPGLGTSPLKQIKSSQRFQVCALDIFGPLPLTSNRNEYILVISDYFTKFVEAFAIPDHTALTVADKLVT